MHQIVYISEATTPVSETLLLEYLHHWGESNARAGVTGILLYSQQEHRFMQLIEGEQAIIQQLFNKIEQDIRHGSVLKLADGPIAQRHFSAWLMGFPVVSAAAFKQLAGYLNPTGPAFKRALATTHDDLVRALLASFVTEHALVRLP